MIGAFNLSFKIYFVLWWLTSAVIILNIFVALILDNFIVKWERSQRADEEKTRFRMSLLEMYKDILDEPSFEYVKEFLINVSY